MEYGMQKEVRERPRIALRDLRFIQLQSVLLNDLQIPGECVQPTFSSQVISKSHTSQLSSISTCRLMYTHNKRETTVSKHMFRMDPLYDCILFQYTLKSIWLSGSRQCRKREIKYTELPYFTLTNPRFQLYGLQDFVLWLLHPPTSKY